MSAIVESPAVVPSNSNAESATTNVGKQITFDPNIKHPLKNTWTLWYEYHLSSGKRPATSQWGENMKSIYNFGSVEDFWRLYNNVAPPSHLQQGCSYNLFKKGIEPKWEDPANDKGGKWTIIIQKTKGMLDRMWLWLVLACVGEVLEEGVGEQICGAVVNVRKAQDKLQLWTRDAENREAVMKIGHAIKKVLELPEMFPVGYQSHFQKDTRKNKYEI